MPTRSGPANMVITVSTTREAAVDAAGHALYVKAPERSAGRVSRQRAEEVITVLEALGLVEFEPGPNLSHLEALARALGDVQGGPLTAARVAGALQLHGYEIVRKRTAAEAIRQAEFSAQSANYFFP